MASSTLRDLNELPDTPAALSNATLILIDYQNTYTRGPLELDGWRTALESASRILAAARTAGAPIIHIVHDDGPESLYDASADIGAIHPLVAPIEGEPIVTKGAPNAFVDTDLGDRVDAAGNENVIVIGFMTHMCVTFSSEGAFLRGNAVTVVADACATRALPTVDGEVSANELHRSALATIGDLYGVVVADAGLLGDDPQERANVSGR